MRITALKKYPKKKMIKGKISVKGAKIRITIKKQNKKTITKKITVKGKSFKVKTGSFKGKLKVIIKANKKGYYSLKTSYYI